MKPKAPPITVEQYKAFEGYPGLKDELINREIVLSPQPKPLHQEVLANILFLLREAIEPKKQTLERVTNQKRAKVKSEAALPAPLTGKIALTDIFKKV